MLKKQAENRKLGLSVKGSPENIFKFRSPETLPTGIL